MKWWQIFIDHSEIHRSEANKLAVTDLDHGIRNAIKNEFISFPKHRH